MTRRALVLGATGLVGGLLLRRLLAHPAWTSVTVIGRRIPPWCDQLAPAARDKLRVRTTDLDALSRQASEFAVDDVFCCLGTTLKKAGSRSAFVRVDRDYCVAAARLAKQAQVQRFIMVSAVNANPRGLVFYARVKGEAEREIAALGLASTIFMQPSLLRGERSEQRSAEGIGLAMLGITLPVVAWTGASWLPIDAHTVADAMLAVALDGPTAGVHRLRYRQMQEVASRLPATTMTISNRDHE